MSKIGGSVGVAKAELEAHLRTESKWKQCFHIDVQKNCSFRFCFKLLVAKKVSFYSLDCHSESGCDSDCLSGLFFVSGNMLSAGRKTYCSVTKESSVNAELSACC